MANQKESGGLPVPVRFVIGLAMAVGGFWVSKNIKIEFLEELAHKGIHFDPGKSVAVVGAMIMLFPVIKQFYTTPLEESIDGRNSELEKTFTEVETLRSDMARMRSEYEKRIADTEAEAREQIQNQVKEAQTMRNQMIQEAAAAKEEMVKKAQMEIDAEKSRVLTDLRLHVVNLTMGATEKLLGETVDNDRNRRLVEDFIDKIEVPR